MLDTLLAVNNNKCAYQSVIVPCLELTTPQTAKVHVVASIAVSQDSGVDAVSTRDVAWLGLEFSVWLVGFGYSDSEDAVLVLGGEVQEVFTMLLSHVRSPELLRSPWDIWEVQNLH